MLKRLGQLGWGSDNKAKVTLVLSSQFANLENISPMKSHEICEDSSRMGGTMEWLTEPVLTMLKKTLEDILK